MAFDRNDPADLAALKSEVETDPIGMGYAAQLSNTAQLLKLLNEPANNVGGETGNRVFDYAALLDALDPNELDAQQTEGGAGDYIVALMALSGAGRVQDLEPWKQKFRGMFSANGATVTALDAQTSPLSRAEVLFGQGTIITREDWFAARDS
jgi:hypothetical protein